MPEFKVLYYKGLRDKLTFKQSFKTHPLYKDKYLRWIIAILWVSKKDATNKAVLLQRVSVPKFG